MWSRSRCWSARPQATRPSDSHSDAARRAVSGPPRGESAIGSSDGGTPGPVPVTVTETGRMWTRSVPASGAHASGGLDKRRMARRPRRELTDGVFHTTARGTNRTRIVEDAIDCDAFTSLLRRVARRWTWRLYAFCLMPNHHHIVVAATLEHLSTRNARIERSTRDAVQPTPRPNRPSLPGAVRRPPDRRGRVPGTRVPVRPRQPRSRRARPALAGLGVERRRGASCARRLAQSRVERPARSRASTGAPAPSGGRFGRLAALAAPALELAPEEIRVRDQEPERQPGQGR